MTRRSASPTRAERDRASGQRHVLAAVAGGRQGGLGGRDRRRVRTRWGAASPTTVLTYGGPVSNDAVTLSFQQAIGSSDALRTGSYSKTLTFTLSTTTP